MKRRYAAGNGWILGVCFGYLSNVCTAASDDCERIELYEMRYSFGDLLEIMKHDLTEYYVFCQKERAANDVYKLEISDWLGRYSLIYKGEDYQLEEEIRLVCEFPSDFSAWENKKHGVQFKASVSGYDASVKMSLDKKKLVYASQKLGAGFDTSMNKQIIYGKSTESITML